MSDPQPTDVTAANLAQALETLLSLATEPTGPVIASITITDPATGAQHHQQLTAPQTSVLQHLLTTEAQTECNDQRGGSGWCEHCDGSGGAHGVRPEDRDGYIGDDGLCYFADGTLDEEASAALHDHSTDDAPYDEDD